MNKNKQTEKEFHAVEFMRHVRSELTEGYLKDKQKYFDHLKKQWRISNSDRREHTASKQESSRLGMILNDVTVALYFSM